MKNNKICEVCSKGFYVRPYRMTSARFCSTQCSGFYGGKRVRNRKSLFIVGHRTNLGKKLVTSGFPKGNVPWNVGKTYSDDYRKKLSLAHIGKPAWNKGRGKVDKYYYKQECKIWRKAVYERDDYTCQICFKRGGKLNAHHIFPASIFLEKVYDVDNGKTLCLPCHRKTDSYGLNAIAKRRELQERLSKLTCSEAWAETLTNVQRLGTETILVSNVPTSALAPALG